MAVDYLRKLFDERTNARRTELVGEIISRFHLTPFDPQGTLMPTADVRLSGQILSAIPLAANNRDLLYAQPGTAVTLARSGSGRLEVTGLAKRGFGTIFTYTLTVPELTPANSGTNSALATTVLVSTSMSGFLVSICTFGELASATSGGFGQTPFEALLLKNASGTILNVIA